MSAPQLRFKDAAEGVRNFAEECLVHCPQCSKKSHVKYLDRTPESNSRWKFTCTHCGHNAIRDTSGWNLGTPIDPGFGLPLWLSAPCCAETLWAYNEKHLDHIEAFVGAMLRETFFGTDPPSGYANGSLASRYPKWMIIASNRDAILKCCQSLRTRLK